jgi:enterochelin esterase-like enzyme
VRRSCEARRFAVTVDAKKTLTAHLASFLAVSSPTAAAGPLVERGRVTFRLPDPDARLTGVRLQTDRGFPVASDRFVRGGDGWTLRLPMPALDRFEYALEIEHAGGEREYATDPANPLRAPGAFGEKSVVELPGYAPPAWLDAPCVAARTDDLAVAASALGADVHVAVWRPDDAPDGEPLPLLVAHDGPELDGLARLTDYVAAQVAAGRLPRHRVALLAPGDRDQWYSASALYARTLVARVLPAIGEAVAVRRPVGMGASLGALAMLHAHRRFPDAFAALFLQSGSFFMPRFDAQEAGFVRYRRIVRFVRATLREPARRRVPLVLTCGTLEENAHNNRVTARALAAQGQPASLAEVRDLHNFTAWRDAWDPHLTRLLSEVWR